MHMQQSAKVFLQNLPIKVEFAGFMSDTLRLARSGWDLSLRQQLNPRYGEPELQLAMRHGNHNHAIYALSHPLHCRDQLYQALQTGNERAYQSITNMVFSIMCMSNDIAIRTSSMTTYGLDYRAQFNPIDAYPQEMDMKEFNLRDFKFFKTASPDVKDLIVSPEQVPELMDVILKVQSKTREEIRRREESRANYKSYTNGEMFNAKPAHSVQAQIITLAG